MLERLSPLVFFLPPFILSITLINMTLLGKGKNRAFLVVSVSMLTLKSFTNRVIGCSISEQTIDVTFLHHFSHLKASHLYLRFLLQCISVALLHSSEPGNRNYFRTCVCTAENMVQETNLLVSVEAGFIRKDNNRGGNDPPCSFKKQKHEIKTNEYVDRLREPKLSQLFITHAYSFGIGNRSTCNLGNARDTEPLAYKESLANEIRVYGTERLRRQTKLFLDCRACVTGLDSIHSLAGWGL